MSTTFKINEVDRQTNRELAGMAIETAGPLAMATPSLFDDKSSYDDFSPSNPFAQTTVDYSAYSSSPVASNVSESSYAIAMAGFLGSNGNSFSGDVGGFSFDGGFSDGGFSGGDGGFSGGGFSGGDGGFSGGGSFSASC